MTAGEMQDPARGHRALQRSSLQRKEELLRELQKTREEERVRLLEADAAKTARLRALRLAKEAATAEPETAPLKGADIEP